MTMETSAPAWLATSALMSRTLYSFRKTFVLFPGKNNMASHRRYPGSDSKWPAISILPAFGRRYSLIVRTAVSRRPYAHF